MTEEQWSPAQIVGYLRKKGEECVCVETIYAYIRADRANGGDLWKHCRHQLKQKVYIVAVALNGGLLSPLGARPSPEKE